MVNLTVVPSAMAQDGPRIRMVLVDVNGNRDAAATDIQYFLEKGIRQSGRQINLMPVDLVLNAGAQGQDAQNIAMGNEAYAEGVDAFNSGDCGKAVEKLGEATTYYEQSFAFLEDVDRYTMALVRQGYCLAATKKKALVKAALQVLSKAFTIKPRMNYEAFDKDKDLFEQARDLVRDKALSSIAVTTTPAGSRVFVNGRYRGVSPAFRPGLRQGVHFVRVERQGYARFGEKVNTEVKGRAKTSDYKLDVELQVARKKALLDALLPGLNQEIGLGTAGTALSRLRSLLLVDYIALFRGSGRVENKRVEVALYNMRTGQMLKRVTANVDWDSRSRTAKNAVIDLAQSLMKVEFETVVKVAQGTVDSHSGRIVDKWWFWSVIGVVTLGGIAGLAVALAPETIERKGINRDGNGSIILRFGAP